MKNLKPFIQGVIGLIVGFGIAMFLSESDPPDNLHVIGILIGSISAFYLVIMGTIRFAFYLLKVLGYTKDH